MQVINTYSNFCFAVHAYKHDQHLIKRLLEQINTHCQCETIVIGDGVKLEEHCKKDTLWFELARAKAEGQRGFWTHRYLEVFLKHTEATHLLRVDPDTCIWRPFLLPNGNYDLFGNISKKYRYPYVRGGCIGFTRTAAEKIVNSGFLLDDCYKGYNYKRYKTFRWEHEQESDEEFAFQDWIVGDVCHRLSLVLQSWEEIYILGNCNVIPEVNNYIITHPHPLL